MPVVRVIPKLIISMAANLTMATSHPMATSTISSCTIFPAEFLRAGDLPPMADANRASAASCTFVKNATPPTHG